MTSGTSQPLVLRRSAYALHLIDFFKKNAEIKHILPRRRLGFEVGGERYCYLILKGSCTVHRNSDDRVMSTVTSPALVGLSNLVQLETEGYIKTLTSSDIAILDMITAHEIISSNQLWEPVAKHMMVIAGKLFQSGEQLTAPNSYDIVRAQLNELMNESPNVRENTTAEYYIREKTQLSRSGIMRILSQLKKGGFIEINRGVLNNIIYLPKKF